MDLYIDPRSCLNYSSYYILGMYRTVGKAQVHFSSKYFGELEEIDMLLAFVACEKGKPQKRYIVDYRDLTDIIPQAYAWSDIYAKINYHKTETQTPDGGAKIVVIALSFAVKIWNRAETLAHLAANFAKGRIYRYAHSPNIHLRPSRWARNYLTLLHRNYLETYTAPLPAQPNVEKKDDKKYVFFLSTLWNGSKESNTWCTQYIKACIENKQIDFEGGFYLLSSSQEQCDLPAEYQFHRYLPNHIYMEKIRRSALVFNTPAVLRCHGWKLAEYLCMGKAILSTPLSNELPAPLEHGKHLYIVQTEAELSEAVGRLIADASLRHRLEQNARSYYEQYATPKGVMNQLLSLM